jgi:hypothetical protein
VIANRVTPGADLPQQLRTGSNRPPYDKKTSAYAVALQQTEQVRSNRRVRAVVEGQRDRPALRKVVQRGTKEFGRGTDGAPNTTSRGNSRRHRDHDGPRIQARLFSHGEVHMTSRSG